MADTQFNLTPFALPNTPADTVRLEEPRDIVAVEVTFASLPASPPGLSYLQNHWPHIRVEEAAKDDPCGFGWIAQDDWFNVQWRSASVKPEQDGDVVRFTFNGLRSEFPEIEGYDVPFRRTLGIRIDTPEPQTIRDIRVYSASKPKQCFIHVFPTKGYGEAPRIEGYNAHVDAIEASSKQDGWKVAVRHMAPVHPFCGDEGLLTFHNLSSNPFTISLESLKQEGSIWYAEGGVFITCAGDAETVERYRERYGDAKTLLERVPTHPEQSFSRALWGQPRPHPVSYAVGCALARQCFWIEHTGDIVLTKDIMELVPGKDTPRFKNTRDGRFYFGLEHWTMVNRHPDPEPVLAYTIQTRRDGIELEQRILAVPLRSPELTTSWEGDDTIIGLVRFRFTNHSAEKENARLRLSYSQDASRNHGGRGPHPGTDGTLTPRYPLDAIAIDNGMLYSVTDEGRILRAAIDTEMRVQPNNDAVDFRMPLEPGQTCELVLKAPYIALDTDEECQALQSIDFEQSDAALAAFWRHFVNNGARTQTPERRLEALHTMHPVHVAVTDLAMPGNPRLINTSVGTVTYGNFSNEACMIIQDLDQRGLHDEARRRLEVFLEYQGTVPQPGNFTDCDGMFFGAGGFEMGAYNQHHGWVLWGLCEHFFLTHDQAWFESIVPKVIEGADWIFRQRNTMLDELPHSRRWERGFLPAGSLEDVTDFYYWLSTNSLTWRGANHAARALERIGHPDAVRIRREADAYGASLREGFETACRYSPLVRLRNGDWIPHYPSRLYRRGRETGWIRETLEGAVYLLISGLYRFDEAAAEWILNDFQDNRYSAAPYGYAIEDFEATWFDRAGFSMQPTLLAGLLPHLDRDEPEVYIWMFMNALASCYREEIRAIIEHPMPVLGYSNNALFKTSDQSNAMMWLRYMFVYGASQTLWLGKAIPRAWFAHDEPIAAEDVVTYFGKVSVCYSPAIGDDRIEARVSINLVEHPEHIYLRFRHPAKKPIQSAQVNGDSWDRIRPDIEVVDLSGLEGEINVTVYY